MSKIEHKRRASNFYSDYTVDDLKAEFDKYVEQGYIGIGEIGHGNKDKGLKSNDPLVKAIRKLPDEDYKFVTGKEKSGHYDNSSLDDLKAEFDKYVEQGYIGIGEIDRGNEDKGLKSNATLVKAIRKLPDEDYKFVTGKEKQKHKASNFYSDYTVDDLKAEFDKYIEQGYIGIFEIDCGNKDKGLKSNYPLVKAIRKLPDEDYKFVTGKEKSGHYDNSSLDDLKAEFDKYVEQGYIGIFEIQNGNKDKGLKSNYPLVKAIRKLPDEDYKFVTGKEKQKHKASNFYSDYTVDDLKAEFDKYVEQGYIGIFEIGHGNKDKGLKSNATLVKAIRKLPDEDYKFVTGKEKSGHYDNSSLDDLKAEFDKYVEQGYIGIGEIDRGNEDKGLKSNATLVKAIRKLPDEDYKFVTGKEKQKHKASNFYSDYTVDDLKAEFDKYIEQGYIGIFEIDCGNKDKGLKSNYPLVKAIRKLPDEDYKFVTGKEKRHMNKNNGKNNSNNKGSKLLNYSDIAIDKGELVNGNKKKVSLSDVMSNVFEGEVYYSNIDGKEYFSEDEYSDEKSDVMKFLRLLNEQNNKSYAEELTYSDRPELIEMYNNGTSPAETSSALLYMLFDLMGNDKGLEDISVLDIGGAHGKASIRAKRRFEEVSGKNVQLSVIDQDLEGIKIIDDEMINNDIKNLEILAASLPNNMGDIQPFDYDLITATYSFPEFTEEEIKETIREIPDSKYFFATLPVNDKEDRDVIIEALKEKGYNVKHATFGVRLPNKEKGKNYDYSIIAIGGTKK